MSFSIKNCRVTVNFLFVAVLAVFFLFDRSGMAILGVTSASIHELGHLAVMVAFGAVPSQIRFTPFGIDMIKSAGINRSYWQDAIISVAGPGTNLAAALICTLADERYFHFFILANLVLAGFNLLPVEPLDGGQALYSILCIRMNSTSAARVVSITSFAVLTPLAVVGFLFLFRANGNFYLFTVCVYLIFLLLLKNGRYY
ncbi:metalloprotease [Caproiciproducens faecalis]|uniref:Peptidase M50 n=1 Tax=Caproiciproducens faecalis TaxID=2820301 RepID=A0ABS7DRT8_9FIRM|nr:site-2 protease family protein [Caproiciproducens faecalis]MBW7574016.1 peptidase M50 [Caproiciproducens faecalis]